MSELNNWLRDGKERWDLVEKHGEIAVFWNNPCYRFVGIATVGLIALIAGLFFRSPILLTIAALISLPSIFIAIKYYLMERKVQGIAAFVSTLGCSIGCGFDRLFIPWSAINLNYQYLPINDKYMLIPIKEEALNEIIIQYQGGDSTLWDRTPYVRAIIRAEYYASEGVRIYAYPNEVMVHYLGLVYPILTYRFHEAKKDSDSQ